MLNKDRVPAAPQHMRTDLVCYAPNEAIERWNPCLRLRNRASDDGPAPGSVDIFGMIGKDWLTDEGNTVKRISAALRHVGERAVIVNINSPGGDFFEGLAIFNLLREHPHEVTCRVLGIALSAASIIAMGGDTVLMPRAGFIMVHNVHAIAYGDKQVMREMATTMEPFDDLLADVFAARSNVERKEVVKMLDNEAWLSGTEAVEKGFADSLLASDEVEETPDDGRMVARADYRVDAIMARAGTPRSLRRELIREIRGTPSAAAAVMPSADRIAAAARDARGILQTV